jgi:hypothetical protein
MRRFENVLVMLAAMLVAGGVVPWPYRLECIIGAVVVIAFLALARMRAHAGTKQKERTRDVYAVVAKIRADRAERFERPAARRRRE